MVAQFRQRAPLGLALQNSIMPGDQPQFGMGDFPAQPHSYAQGPKQEKGGFFKEGGMGRTIAGLIGDALLQQGGMAPVYSPMMRQQQAMKAEEAQWSRRRDIERADRRADQQWEWNNKPQPERAPTEFERMLEASGVQRGSDEWTRAMARAVENRLNPMMAVQTVDADGNPAITYTPRNPTSGAMPPSQNVPTVSDEASYNALAPGAQYRDPNGKLRTKTGGPTQPASGGFQR